MLEGIIINIRNKFDFDKLLERNTSSSYYAVASSACDISEAVGDFSASHVLLTMHMLLLYPFSPVTHRNPTYKGSKES
jgi:hypothetical protein